MHFKYLLVGFLAVLYCTGCSKERKSLSNQSQPDSVQVHLPDFSSINTSDVFVYNCGDSLQFTAHVAKDSTWLFLPDTTLKVMPVPAGSGAKYQGSSYIYWSKGDKAILQKPKGSFMMCKTIPREKSWQAAKLRGVDFRALGQEPGWYLEITDGQQIRYVGNYGQDTVHVPMPKPAVEGQHKVYRAKTESHTLKIKITNAPCTDSMSGFKFPSTVTITVDGKTYTGCGRTLD